MAGRNHDRFAEIARSIPAAGLDVGVFLAHAVADHMAVEDRELVAGTATTRLMNVWLDSAGVGTSQACGLPARSLVRDPAHGLEGVRPGRRMEHHDVAHARVADQAVGEHPLAHGQRRHHRRARDPVGLDDECLNQQRQAHRDRDRHHQLDQRLHRASPTTRHVSGALQESDPAGGPVGEERVADDPGLGHRTPEAAVLGIGRLSPIM